jgi:hypothetical protein
MLKSRNHEITLVGPTEPYSSVSLDLLKLQGGLGSSNRWNRMACVPFEQDMIWDMRWIQCHQERPAGRFDVLFFSKKRCDIHEMRVGSLLTRLRFKVAMCIVDTEFYLEQI